MKAGNTFTIKSNLLIMIIFHRGPRSTISAFAYTAEVIFSTEIYALALQRDVPTATRPSANSRGRGCRGDAAAGEGANAALGGELGHVFRVIWSDVTAQHLRAFFDQSGSYPQELK
jgi:hypothetical protein